MSILEVITPEGWVFIPLAVGLIYAAMVVGVGRLCGSHERDPEAPPQPLRTVTAEDWLADQPTEVLAGEELRARFDEVVRGEFPERAS